MFTLYQINLLYNTKKIVSQSKKPGREVPSDQDKNIEIKLSKSRNKYTKQIKNLIQRKKR